MEGTGMGKYPYRVELLAPAGSRDAFVGAVSAGADAVYLGGEQFGARAYADNFTTEEIVRALGEAHVLGRKIYLTANVLTREDEMPDLVRFVRELYEAGLDGVIVQDTGVLAALQEACPGLPLHASTQMSVTSVEAVEYLRRLGVSRVVPARELSLEEIGTLRREDAAYLAQAGTEGGRPIEIEAFIHGAMCYSYSGRCLMSSFLGGRSGNRGRCAGTCRLPCRILDDQGDPVGPDARKKEVWPLSMKDMCVLSILPELIDAGIHSFKIEGRMKKPVYAAGVTAVYRKYIDRCYDWMEAGRPTPWTVEEEDLERLRRLYIRTELGTGYYHTRNGRSLVTIGKPGYAGTDAALEEEIRKLYLGSLPKRPVTGRARFRIGEPAILEVSALPAGMPASEDPAKVPDHARAAENAAKVPDHARAAENAAEVPDHARVAEKTAKVPAGGRAEVRVTGAIVQEASGRPLDPGELNRRLQKTGDSLFTFEDLEIEADDNIFLPVSDVNRLRREAMSALADLCAGRRSASADKGPVSAENLTPAGRGPSPVTDLTPADRGPVPVADPAPPALRSADSCPAPGDFSEQKKEKKGTGMAGQELWALVSTPGQMEAAAAAGCSCILIDGDFGPEKAQKTRPSGTHNGNKSVVKRTEDSGAKKIRYICALPPVFRVDNRESAAACIRSAWERGFSGILVRTLEELELVRKLGYDGEIIADSSLYSWNGRSLAALAGRCDRIVASLELSMAGIRDAVRASSLYGDGDSGQKRADGTAMRQMILPVYGRVPMMESAGCVRKTENRCTKKDGFWFLADRMGKKLPVRCRCGTCSNTIYNAVPLSLHQYADSPLFREVPVLLCMFTTEDPVRTGQILTFFGKLRKDRPLDGKEGGRRTWDRRGKRKKAADLPFEEFTNGHFRTGAL